MSRKSIPAKAAAIALALACPATTTWAADLHAAGVDAWRPRPRVVWGPHFYNGLPVSFGYGLCYQLQLMQTPWGLRERLVNQCW